MKLFCVLGVVLLSVVELEATSVSQFACVKRNLTATVDDILWLYIDGIEITGLPNAGIAYTADVVDLPCTTRLIAIHGRNGPNGGAAILASTDDGYIVTNSTWKCSNITHSGWEEIDFDDSAWMPAVEFGHNGDDDWLFVPGIRTNAAWIWLRLNMDADVYCRKRLDPNYCTTISPCEFGGTCIDEPNGEYQCICAPGYTGKNCSFVTNNCESFPCLNGGTCLNGINYYVCVCPAESTGVRCQTLIDACDSNPCLNNGTCNNLGGDSFTCTCPIYLTGVICESPNYNEAFACGTTLAWSQYNASNGFTRLCYFWTPPEDIDGRNIECRHTITGIPLYDDYVGLLNAGGNFGCIVTQNYPEDLPVASRVSCADNYQQDVSLGSYSETARLMVCIRYPYEGVPGTK